MRTVPCTITVTADIVPRNGQSHEDALAEMHKCLSGYVAERICEDFGAEVAEIERFQAGHPADPSWGGYAGPFVTKVEVQ